MAAMTRSREAKRRGMQAPADPEAYKMAANVRAFQGGIAAINAAGFVAPATTAIGLVIVGVFDEEVDNTGGANGAKVVHVRPGVFALRNHGPDPVVQDRMGRDCFVVDDQTVAATDGTNTRSRAGKVALIEGNDIWVQMALGM